MTRNLLVFILLILTIAHFSCNKNRDTSIQREEEGIINKGKTVLPTVEVVRRGKQCANCEMVGCVKCDYKVGNDLEFTLWWVGYPDGSFNVGKSIGEDGEYAVRFVPEHFCAMISAGAKTLIKVKEKFNPDQQSSFIWNDRLAYISPANGEIYADWAKCETVTTGLFATGKK